MMMPTLFMRFYKQLYVQKTLVYIAILCMIVLLLSTKGITDESVISMQGDMARYLVNGTYFYDLSRDFGFLNPLQYAYRYFAKYPALSLGHHPLLPGMAEVPFYALFGISVFSARVTTIAFMVLGTIAWVFLVKLFYDEEIAFLSSLLFITSPFIVEYSRVVMSEIPALALLILATCFLGYYCQSEKKSYAFLSAVTLVLSLYSKHLVIFMIPVFLVYLLTRKGFKVFFRSEILYSAILIVILLLPLVVITLKFSQLNVAWVVQKKAGTRLSLPNLAFYLKFLWGTHLSKPALLCSVLGIIRSLFKKDSRGLIFLGWILGCYLLLVATGVQKNARYAIYWIPAFCLFAAAIVYFFQTRRWKISVAMGLLAVGGYQGVVSFQAEPEYADGYEQAAQYIVEQRKGESVLYHGVIDTGYFIFFVRKHDRNRDIIVLRSDKLLATSQMAWFVEDRINSREEIYDILQRYGVGYVVIEDIKSQSPALELLRQEVKSERFILRKKILIRSNYSNVHNVPLIVYEYKDYTPPKEGVMLEMNIPLMGDSIQVPFKELL